MFKLFKKITLGVNPNPGDKIIHRCESYNVKVGNYPLRSIFYDQKKTDDGKLLDTWNWCVVIGCHYLWMDDFYDFLNHYNLNLKFGIVKTDYTKAFIKHNKLKIKL